MNTPEKQLNKLRKRSKPSKEFKKELWSELSVAWGREYPRMSIFWRRAIAVPMAAIVLFVTMGTGVYAYSSPEVTEDTPLYPVKRGIESVEERFHRSSQSRSKFHARMAERRIAEGEVMLRRGTLTKDQLIHIANQLNLTVDDVIEAKEDLEKREELKQDLFMHIQLQNDRYRSILQEARNNPPPNFDPNNGIRNILQETRVRISESDLSEEEKRALFLHDSDQELITNPLE